MSASARDPCATCGACCRSYVVPVCGHDVWSISRGQRLDPEQFLITYPQREAGPDGFRLVRDGPTHGLALDKRGPLRAEGPCVFLLQLGGGTERCGIYAQRPVVCRSYPMSMWRDAAVPRDDALCPPGSWSAEDAALPAWRNALQAQRMHFDVYHLVVSGWNARVTGSATHRAPHEYFSYLLNVYERLAALTHEVGAPAMARVQAGWRSMSDACDSDAAQRREEELIWRTYVARVLEVLDRFHEGAPPRAAAKAGEHSADAPYRRTGASATAMVRP